jgi:hypothetical protein
LRLCIPELVCSMRLRSNSIAPTARKRSNILDFEWCAGYRRNPTNLHSGTSSGPVSGLSTVEIGTENTVRETYPQNQPRYNKWRTEAARTTPSVGDCVSPSAAAAVGDSSPPAAVPDSPPPSVLSSCIAVITSRVIGLPRASELPPRTMRTCSVDRRVSSSNSWDADTDADAELTADWCSMSSEGWGERVWRRLILGCLVPLVVRLNGRGAFTLTILLYHSEIHWGLM